MLGDGQSTRGCHQRPTENRQRDECASTTWFHEHPNKKVMMAVLCADRSEDGVADCPRGARSGRGAGTGRCHQARPSVTRATADDLTTFWLSSTVSMLYRVYRDIQARDNKSTGCNTNSLTSWDCNRLNSLNKVQFFTS